MVRADLVDPPPPDCKMFVFFYESPEGACKILLRGFFSMKGINMQKVTIKTSMEINLQFNGQNFIFFDEKNQMPK